MTHTADNGGPAFPHGGNELEHAQQGMTLRDYFAGQAIAGLLTHIPPAGMPSHVARKKQAETAYQIADEMLAARKGGAA